MARSTWLKDALLLTLITSLFFGVFLGSRNLSAPDELRYSEIPREMIVYQDYVIPKINGVKYFEKPPLFYWMQVANIKAFGLNEWSLRLATAFMGLLGVLATYGFTRRIYNRKTAWMSALILSSMILYFSMAHVITLDMTVSVFITLSLYSFYFSVKNKQPLCIYLGFIAVAAGMMTKGLIALIFPGVIIGLWLTLFKRWREVKWPHFFAGFILFVILTAPWHIIAQLHAPEFWHFYFIEQQFLRYATSIANRYQPWYFYIPVLILGTLPWSVFLPSALLKLKKSEWKRRWHNENEYFFLIWFLFVLLFFSASNSKLIPYILPGLPPIAIIIAHYLSIYRKNFTKPFVNIYLITNLILILAILNVGYFDNHTIKSLILKVESNISPQDDVVAYHGYHQDLPFYLKRIITVNGSFDELSFGAEHGKTERWMIDDSDFKKRWLSTQTLYVFISSKKYDEFKREYQDQPGIIIASEQNNLVIVNHNTKGNV